MTDKNVEFQVEFLDGVEDTTTGGGNIKNRVLFLPDTPITQDIFYARENFKELAKQVVEFVKIDFKKHAIITGSRGSGKTALVSFLIKMVDVKYSNVNIHYVNCRHEHNSYKVMRKVINETKRMDSYTVREQAFKVLSRKGEKHILVLDEADMLKDDNILYDVTRDNELTNVMLFLISNKPNFYQNLSEDVKSSLGMYHEFYYFDRYNAIEMKKIFSLRAKGGFNEYDEDTVDAVGAINTKQFNSDVRVGLGTLYNIFKVKPNGHKIPTDEIIKMMKSEEVSIKNKTITQLTDVKLLLLYLISLGNEESNNLFRALADGGYSYVKSTFFQFLDELEKLDLIYQRKERRSKSFVKLIDLRIPEGSIETLKSLIKDKMLA